MLERLSMDSAGQWLRRRWWQAAAAVVAIVVAAVLFLPGEKARVAGGTPEERAASIGKLADEKPSGAADAIAGAVRDASPRVREAAMAGLGRLGQRADLVEAGLRDSDATVRYAAAVSFGGMKPAEATRVLGELALNGPDARTRQGALLGLSLADTPQAANQILRVIDVPDPVVARSAMDVLTAKLRMRWDTPPDPAKRREWSEKVGILQDFVQRWMESEGR